MATINQMVKFSLNNYNSSPNSKADTTGTILKDYTSIKNGSYKKLLKAYYQKTGSIQINPSISTSKEPTKVIVGIKNAASDLVKSADDLTTKGSKSLFKQSDITSKDDKGNKTTQRGYNKDVLYKAVNGFVNDYNTMIDNGSKADSKAILKSTLSLTQLSKSNKSLLGQVGITVGSDNKLTINEETFKKADISAVRTLFNGSNSYAATVSAKASKINSTATVEILKANTYTNTANYNNAYVDGAIFNDFF